MTLLQSRKTTSVDQPPRTLSRRGSLPANFVLCASPSAQTSTSGNGFHLQNPVGPKQRPRSISLPARPDGSSVSPFSNSSPALTTLPSYRARGGRRLCIPRRRFPPARPRNHDQARSTSSRHLPFYTGWKEVKEGGVGKNGVKQEAEESGNATNNLSTASRRRFSFRDPPQRDGLVVLTLPERLALTQPAPGAQRSARRSFTRRPSVTQRPLSPGSSSGDADDEASDTPPSSSSGGSNTDEESLSPPPPSDNNNKPKPNHPQQPLFPPHPPLEINLLSLHNQNHSHNKDPNPDKHTATLNNPRLHIGELAHPPPAASGAAYPVFRTTPGNRRLSEAGPRRRKSVVAEGATMPVLYLRRVEGGGVALSEGEEGSESSKSSASSESSGCFGGGGGGVVLGDEEGAFEGSGDVTLQGSEEGAFQGSGDVTLEGSSSGGGGDEGVVLRDENGGLAQLRGMVQGGALESVGKQAVEEKGVEGAGEAGDEMDIDAM